jgi:hypothetical protein
VTGSDARALAQHLVQRSDDALPALFAARHVSPTASWNDAFDAAEALLDPSSIERALRGLTSSEISALADAAVDTDDAARSRLQQLALVDEQGVMYEAVSSALTALTAASTPAADVDEAEDTDAAARPDDAAPPSGVLLARLARRHPACCAHAPVRPHRFRSARGRRPPPPDRGRDRRRRRHRR